MQRRNRLTRSRDFDHVYRRGRSVSTRFLTLYWFDREEGTGDPRLGLAVPREVGNAVVRNRIKRQLRDLFRERVGRVAATHDYVLRVRAGLPEASGYRLIQTLEETGAVVRGPRGRYRPGMLLVSLAGNVAIGELLRYDLDGDGIVTRAEVVQVETRRLRSARKDPRLAQDELSILQRIDQAADLRMRADLNKDGRIDWPEMQAFAKQAPALSELSFEPTFRMIMSFDKDGDGAVTIEEFDRAAERVFHAIDVDKDRTLSNNEIAAFRREVEQAAASKAASVQAEIYVQGEKRMHERQAKTKQACAMPQPSAAATVLLLEAYDGDALSTVTIGSQWIATETGSIDIEPGTGPLYVVISSYTPVIWQLSGAVDRVERLVLAGESTGPNESVPGKTPLIGATGVPPERIVFLGQPGCMTYHAGPSVPQSQAAAEAVRRETGRPALVIKPRKQDAAKATALSFVAESNAAESFFHA